MADEVEVGVGDKKLRITGDSVNLIFTVLGVLLTAVVAYVLWAHGEDAKAGRVEFVQVLKESAQIQREATAVTREQTCLLKFDQKDRQVNADFCKQVAGVTSR